MITTAVSVTPDTDKYVRLLALILLNDCDSFNILLRFRGFSKLNMQQNIVKINDRHKTRQEKIACPLCLRGQGTPIYPTDQEYLKNMTGGLLEGSVIGVAHCSACGHQFISPVPSIKFLEAFYASYMSAAKKGFYARRLAKDIPVGFRLYYGHWLDRALLFRQGQSGSLLDIGCGLGMFLRLARERGFVVSGIEPNSEAVGYLTQEFGIEVANSLLENYNSTQSFDVVTMWDLLEHLADPGSAIAKVKSLLKPGGLLVLEIPVRDSLLHWVAKLLYRLTFGVVKRPLYLTYGVHHLQYFSEKSISDFLTRNGFEILASHRSDTDIESIRRRPSASLFSKLKVGMYNFTLTALLYLARIMGKQNKVVVFARVDNG